MTILTVNNNKNCGYTSFVQKKDERDIIEYLFGCRVGIHDIWVMLDRICWRSPHHTILYPGWFWHHLPCLHQRRWQGYCARPIVSTPLLSRSSPHWGTPHPVVAITHRLFWTWACYHRGSIDSIIASIRNHDCSLAKVRSWILIRSFQPPWQTP